MLSSMLWAENQCNCISIKPEMKTLRNELQRLNLEMVSEGFLTALEVKPTLEDQIKIAQRNDKAVKRIKEKMKAGKAKCFIEDN